MLIAPNTNIYLLKCPLELDNKNQLTFNNKEEQFEFFYNLPKKELHNSTYQRKQNYIRYPENIENIINYNYVMYQNLDYNDKWFYAFIIDMKFENPNMTNITISTDVFQTWQFDINFKQSFVEREMINVTDDIPGANLLPEGLEIGEVIAGGTAELDELEPVYIVAYGRNPHEDGLTSETIDSNQGVIVNGIPNRHVFWNS